MNSDRVCPRCQRTAILTHDGSTGSIQSWCPDCRQYLPPPTGETRWEPFPEVRGTYLAYLDGRSVGCVQVEPVVAGGRLDA